MPSPIRSNVWERIPPHVHIIFREEFLACSISAGFDVGQNSPPLSFFVSFPFFCLLLVSVCFAVSSHSAA